MAKLPYHYVLNGWGRYEAFGPSTEDPETLQLSQRVLPAPVRANVVKTPLTRYFVKKKPVEKRKGPGNSPTVTIPPRDCHALVTEGAKKIFKLIQHGRLTIGLGVWNFRAGKYTQAQGSPWSGIEPSLRRTRREGYE
jgi:hypothetical protein